MPLIERTLVAHVLWNTRIEFLPCVSIGGHCRLLLNLCHRCIPSSPLPPAPNPPTPHQWLPREGWWGGNSQDGLWGRLAEGWKNGRGSFFVDDPYGWATPSGSCEGWGEDKGGLSGRGWLLCGMRNKIIMQHESKLMGRLWWWVKLGLSACLLKIFFFWSTLAKKERRESNKSNHAVVLNCQ